jgi:hypothetical protein
LSGAHTSAIDAQRGNRGSSALAERMLNAVLFITVLASFVVFIEPAPHDGLIFVLLLTCVTAHVGFDRKLVPLLFLLLAWLIGGSLSLIQVGDQEKSIQYLGTSFYLCIATMTFACLFSGGNMRRLAIMRRGYILAALFATTVGYIGFLHLMPPGTDIFMDNERVSATFKDPNVFGPFLIYPILLILVGLVTDGVRLSNLALLTFLLGGVFLSFSRGAWAHFVVSLGVCLFLLLAAAREPRMRSRIVLFGVVAVIGALLLVLVLTSSDSVYQLFLERAKALQPYDVGPGGRFTLQQLALTVILDNPNGMGPFGFAHVFGLQQHNVYMQGFLVYGWLGGASYLTLVIVTLAIGIRFVRVPSPWQMYLLTAYAAFVGEVFEGLIVDTDHWRHFFLLLALIWGLSIATINGRRNSGASRAERGVAMMPLAAPS